MIRILTLVGLLAIPAAAVDFSLAGKWKATFEQAWYGDKPAPVQVEHFNFEIQDAPKLNASLPSYSYHDANVTGTVTVGVKPVSSHVTTQAISGLLIGAIVKNAKSADGTVARPGSLTLEGYIVSQQQYGAWVQKNKGGLPPSDAGEVELEVSGNALQGYTLTGVVRSGETCPDSHAVPSMFRDVLGEFGRGVPALWSIHVTMKKQ